jgi:hypothetical protein
MDRFGRFIENLRDNPRACQVAARFKREGVELRRVFAELMVYAENRSMAPERKRRGKQHRKEINRSVRENGLSPDVARWLLDRGELAFSTAGLSRVHNVDSLVSLHIYLELKSGRHVTFSELAYLIEAANRALGLRPYDVAVETIAHELRRYRQKNSRFIKILTDDISNRL